MEKDPRETARWLAAAAAGGHRDAEVEYAIALFNGNGLAKDEAKAAEIFLKSARQGNPIAQNRLAHILFRGRGLPADPVQAARWHLIAKAGGNGDVILDDLVAKLTPDDRAAAEKAAKPWFEYLAARP